MSDLLLNGVPVDPKTLERRMILGPTVTEPFWDPPVGRIADGLQTEWVQTTELSGE